MCEAFLSLSLRVEFYQVEGNLLHLRLCLLLESCPCIAAKLIHLGHASFLARILRNLMQRVDVYIQNVAVFVNDAHRFLHAAIHLHLLKSAVDSNTMIDMRDEISRLQFAKRAKSKRLVLVVRLLYSVFMIALKHLMIGVANNLQVFIDKPFVNRSGNGIEHNLGLQVREDRMQSLKLLRIISEYV